MPPLKTLSSQLHLDIMVGVIVSDGMADVVDVVFVNMYCNLAVGCVWVGEVAKGGQLIANQGQEWMGIRATIKEAGSPSK